MRTCMYIGAVLAIAFVGSDARGQNSRPLREAKSPNERFELRIEAGRPGARTSRPCNATLLETAAGAARRRWERPLVNDAAPAQAIIRDDGKFVVTLDEFRRGGARHTLVIYGARGELLRHFMLTDLLTREDWAHVKSARRAVEWLDGAKPRFDDAADAFVVELGWKREIRIDLRRLVVLRTPEEAAAAAQADLPAEIEEMLFGDAGGQDEQPLPDEAAADALMAEDREALARAQADHARQLLEQLLAQQTEQMTPEERTQLEAMIRERMAEAEAAAAAQAAAGDEAARAAASFAEAGTAETTDEPAVEAQVELMAPEMTNGGRQHDPADLGIKTGETAADAGPQTSDPLEQPPGSAIPQPDPANRVNYLSVLNEHTVTQGASAAPLYESAIASQVAWSGESELFDRAMSGDPEALRSPEIQSWLSANRGAINEFREATKYEFNGWYLNSADGSTIGALLPNLAPIRLLAKTSVIEAQAAAADGYPDQAAEIYIDTFAAGSHAGRGVTLIEGLVGVAVQGLATEKLLDLADSAGDEVDFTALSTRMKEQFQPVRPMDEYMDMERVSYLDTVQRAYDYDEGSGKYVPNPTKMRELMSIAGGEGGVEQALLLTQMASTPFETAVKEGNALYDRMRDAARQPYPQARESLRQLEQDLDTHRNSYNPFVRVMVPSLSRAHFLETRGESGRRASLAVANLRAYHQRNGRYPDSLDEVGDADFLNDPFSGGRFAYRRDGDNFVLYSVGGDGLDGGGQHDPKGDTGDLVYWPRQRR